jgi:hypothetical protein
VRRGGPDGQLIMQAHDCIQFGVLFVGIRTAWGATGQWKLAFGPQHMKLFTPGQGPAALRQGSDMVWVVVFFSIKKLSNLITY